MKGRKQALLFLKKKKQKNFYELARRLWDPRSPHDPQEQKFFASFFQKRSPSLEIS
jgi:hypothetical protein